MGASEEIQRDMTGSIERQSAIQALQRAYGAVMNITVNDAVVQGELAAVRERIIAAEQTISSSS